MPIIVGCPGCNGRLRIADHLLDGKVRCPACNEIFQANKQPEIVQGGDEASSDPSLPNLELQKPGHLPDLDRAMDLAQGKSSDPKDDVDLAQNKLSENFPDRPPGEEPPSEEQQDQADEAFRECPDCGKKVHRGTRRCIHCGYRIRKRRLRDYEEDEDYDDEDDDDYGRPRYRNDWVPHRGGLVLALGIISIVTLFICWPLSPLALVPGIVAWVLGRGDLNRIRAGEMDPAGEGTTQAGWICGMIGTGINALAILTCGAIIGITAYMDVQKNPTTTTPPFNAPPKMMNPKPKLPPDDFGQP